MARAGNIKGLHARASAKLAAVVEEFDASATVSKDGMDASGDSISVVIQYEIKTGRQYETI